MAIDYDIYYYEDVQNYLLEQTLEKRLNILLMVIYSIAFILGVIGNGLVIFITGFRMKKTVNTIWFLNLAIADFTFTFFLPLNIVYLALGFHWPFGEAMCKFNSILDFVNLYASVYFLMVISIDRCISVLCPVWAQNHRNPRCASFVALGVWILALMLSSLTIHFKTTLQSINKIRCYSHYSHDKKQAKVTHRAVIISCFIFAFVIPFQVILICYGAIVLRLRRDHLARSSKPFKVITAVIVAFFVCWLPYHVFSFLERHLYKDPAMQSTVFFGVLLATTLTFINSCLNPILYVFMRHDFREWLKHSILSIFENALAEEESQSCFLFKLAETERIATFTQLQFHKDPTQKWISLISVPLATSLGVMNSCLNPILYVFMGHDFKERLKHSILAVFETVFAENGRHNTTQTKAKSSVDLDAQDL
ncbi:chemerin-like receptor 1 [Heteronotia binoei]|uniref:chemerin-like receptor 1 n=1 Tax=Heteronotia binoei TaxID=13085 RepID=UPI00292CE8E6|nr:chemerin-like receptor 1 [Heteronotia binoei]